MAWLIQHKCNDADGVQNYGLTKGHMRHSADSATHQGQPITQAICEACGEQLVFLGHELFDEAETNDSVSNMPPGFVIPRSVRQ